ncbi:MAG: hypothetical protein R3Y64_09445 [Peptostreptococcaceae bacterium]
MEKIVKRSMKVDFHIHSVFSKHKDGDLVKNNTIENRNILIDKLMENNIDMFAITDHDFFSYDLYFSLKEKEKDNTFKKVFPGVEFSVGFIDEHDKLKQIHVICIFNDNDDEKLKKINSIICGDDNKPLYDNGDFFSEEKFISILNKIELDTVFIAHQKSSITGTPSERDLLDLGKTKLNEYLDCEYFEALEFKSKKSGMFNNVFAKKRNDNYETVRFITGSDCHDWSVYPKYDSNEKQEVGFEFTFLKCLPTFKGLAMALTDISRIKLTNNVFHVSDKYLDGITFSMGGKDFFVELSKGINVIIGDNSIGKSLLLHKLTDFKYVNSETKSGYIEYLDNNKISINDTIPSEMLFSFDKQGSIRDKFENKESKNNIEFFKEKFPPKLNSNMYKQLILNELNLFYDALTAKFSYDCEKKKLTNINLLDEDKKTNQLKISMITNNKNKINEYNKIKKYFEDLDTEVSKRSIINEVLLEDEEIERLNDIQKFVKKTKDKYTIKYANEQQIYNIKGAISKAIQSTKEEISSYKTELENKKDENNQQCENIAATIVNLIKLKNKFENYKFNPTINEKIEPDLLMSLNYKFVTKFKNLKVINKDYFLSIFNEVFNKSYTLNVSLITEEILEKQISRFEKSKNQSVIDILKDKINEIINNDLLEDKNIVRKCDDENVKLSRGLLSAIYFDIISSERDEGIYLVDQPEDDISQTNIRKQVIENFKTMALKRQVIIVTHNPQFVVNLDVDNVIFIKKDEDICIEYGALEFEGSDVNILKNVANTLDGGIESIKKRWKRYDKETSFE